VEWGIILLHNKVASVKDTLHCVWQLLT
jgi:hypothetical protein